MIPSDFPLRQSVLFCQPEIDRHKIDQDGKYKRCGLRIMKEGRKQTVRACQESAPGFQLSTRILSSNTP